MNRFLPSLLALIVLLTGCGSARKTSSSADEPSGKTTPSSQQSRSNNAGGNKSQAAKNSGPVSITLSDVPKDGLTQQQQQQLNTLVRDLKRKGNSHLTIIGHSDSIGTFDVNKAVSLKRARLVADYLISKGIAKERITVRGESYSHPIAGNNTAAGRALNRRVEVFVTDSGVYNPYK